MNTDAGRTTIVWRSPAYDGGRTVIGYTVEAKRAGENTWTTIAESCHSLSHTLPTSGANPVAPGESYRFRVRAGNIHGLSHPGVESGLVRIPEPEAAMECQKEEEGYYSRNTLDIILISLSSACVCMSIRKYISVANDTVINDTS